MRKFIFAPLVALLMIAAIGADLKAQGPFSAQIQAALRAFLTTAHTWTGTQTLTNLTVTGTCTGCGSGAAPGGLTNAVQYKVDATTLGGSTLFVVAGALRSTTTGTWFLNAPTDMTSGAFEQVIGVASNDADPKPDHTLILGWNVSNAVSGAGSNGLSFESYCSLGTGCLAGAGGQSETYFALDDGKGNSVRPFGMFQRKNDDGTPYSYMISRGDAWSYWDGPFTTPIWEMSTSSISSHLEITFPQTGDAITQLGSAILGTYTGEITLAPESGATLGNVGEYAIKVASNHFQLTTATIEDLSGNVRISVGAGDAARHLSITNAANTVLFTIAGTDTNPDYEFDTKGTGNFIINNAGNGVFRSYPHAVLGYNTAGVAGTTANACGTTAPSIAGSDVAGKVTVGASGGTSCTVTFGYAWVFAPACTANGVGYTRVTSSTSAFILTGTFAAGEVISYTCLGGQ